MPNKKSNKRYPSDNEPSDYEKRRKIITMLKKKQNQPTSKKLTLSKQHSNHEE